MGSELTEKMRAEVEGLERLAQEPTQEGWMARYRLQILQLEQGIEALTRTAMELVNVKAPAYIYDPKAKSITPLLTHNEIRADFAQRLQRRFQGMSSSAKCTCAHLKQGWEKTLADEHLVGCPRMVWMFAARNVELTLAECNGEEDECSSET